MTKSAELNKKVKKYLKSIYLNERYENIRIKDRNSESQQWNTIVATLKYRNGVFLHFDFKGNYLKYKFFTIMNPMSECPSYEIYNMTSQEINELEDINKLYADIILKIDKLLKYAENVEDFTAIDVDKIDSIIENE